MSGNLVLCCLLLLPATLLLFVSYILVYSHNPVLNPRETMDRVTAVEHLHALHPSPQGIAFTPGPHSAQSRASLCGIRQHSIKSTAGTPVSSVPDLTLFSWDIGQILLQTTAEKEDELQKAFEMLNVGRTMTVTKGEFRRVLETFLFHVTEAEFDAMLAEVFYVIAVSNPLEAVPIYVEQTFSGRRFQTIIIKKMLDMVKTFGSSECHSQLAKVS